MEFCRRTRTWDLGWTRTGVWVPFCKGRTWKKARQQGSTLPGESHADEGWGVGMKGSESGRRGEAGFSPPNVASAYGPSQSQPKVVSRGGFSTPRSLALLLNSTFIHRSTARWHCTETYCSSYWHTVCGIGPLLCQCSRCRLLDIRHQTQPLHPNHLETSFDNSYRTSLHAVTRFTALHSDLRLFYFCWTHGL